MVLSGIKDRKTKNIKRRKMDTDSKNIKNIGEEELRNDHRLRRTVKAYKWLFFWIGLAFLFNLGVYFFFGTEKAIEFLGGYLIEFSLSIDNVFVFLMIFMSFNISEHAQHRVLSYGIAGAIVLRYIFIFFGVSVVNKFEWVLYIFGVIHIISAVRMLKKEDKEKDPHDSPIIRVMKKIIPMTTYFQDEKFFVKEKAKLMATPLFAVLVLIESSDIIFAIDSVPAVISVSRDLFIVYTSNIFAILGLRQLFFVVEHMQERFQYVRYGVAVLLAFTGVKMLLGMAHIHISTPISIGIIAGVLVTSIIVSVIVSKYKEKKAAKKEETDNV